MEPQQFLRGKKSCGTVLFRMLISAWVTLLLLSFPLVVFAHPGGTDESGGHYDHSMGEYHYRHGFPAHQHGEDGSCPYEGQEPYYEEQETQGDSYEEYAKSTKRTKVNSGSSIAGVITSGIIILLFVGYLWFVGQSMPTYSTHKNRSQVSDKGQAKDYSCPICGAPMVPRTSKYGPFYGCSNYPNCYGIRDINGKAKKRRKKGKR